MPTDLIAALRGEDGDLFAKEAAVAGHMQAIVDGLRTQLEALRAAAVNAIERAAVFDDGTDGADAESARSVVAILRGALAPQYVEQQADYTPTGHDNLWRWFGMSYATWLTLPRVLMHAMPDDWQGQMADLLEQWDQAWNTGHLPAPEVSAKMDGKFAAWPAWLLNYRHPDQAAIEAVRAQQGEGERT